MLLLSGFAINDYKILELLLNGRYFYEAINFRTLKYI